MCSRRQEGLSLLEIMMASAILALCFVPILTHSRSTITETETSQEDVLARQFLGDVVERYKGSSMDELRTLAPQPAAPLGTEREPIKSDPLFNYRASVLHDLQAASGPADAAIGGIQKIVDLASYMQLTRSAEFQENAGGPGIHQLTCSVRWKPRSGPAEKSLSISKMVVR